jgi:hypothetical protein
MMTIYDKIITPSIKNKILELKDLEANLGHLPVEKKTLGDLYQKIENSFYERSVEQLERQTEILFAEICEALFERNFNFSEISKEINKILYYIGGPKYCNEEEVKEALGKK